MVGTRSKLKITSSAVNGVPSENTTPCRSLNSQVVGSSMRQLSARQGRTSGSPISLHSVSNTWRSAELFEPMLW